MRKGGGGEKSSRGGGDTSFGEKRKMAGTRRAQNLEKRENSWGLVYRGEMVKNKGEMEKTEITGQKKGTDADPGNTKLKGDVVRGYKTVGEENKGP